MKSTSIRARLLTSVAAIQIVAAALATYLVVQHERHQSYMAFDADLGEKAAALRSLVEAPEEANDAIVFHREFLALPKDDRFLITDASGGKIAGSLVSSQLQALPREPRGVAELKVGAAPYRALVLQRLPVVDPEAEPTPASPTITLIYASPTAPVEAHIQRIELQATAACLALLTVSTLVSAWALTRGLRPLRNLASEAEKIDVGRWTLSELEESKRYSELRPPANALVNLVDRLHAAFDRERQFFGDAAHEMKSSVAIVSSTLQFALQTERSAADYRVELQGALADTRRLQDLVGSMLDLARIESINGAEAKMDISVAEVHAEAQRVVDRFRLMAAHKNIEIEIDGEQHDTWVRISEEDLLTVLSNLVENSIQYSDSGKLITIAIRANGGQCSLSVSDQGCGISSTALPHIFDRFYRGDVSRSRATGGVGLGLSIVKALIQRANGTISVRSEQGKGSAFTIILPSI
jgi:signal transduction histidine kinase